MARLTLEEKKAKLAKQEQALLQKQNQLKARIKKLDAVDKQKKRKDDTRRKILAGSYLMSVEPLNDLKIALDDYLKSDKDRALFGLPPLTNREE